MEVSFYPSHSDLSLTKCNNSNSRIANLEYKVQMEVGNWNRQKRSRCSADYYDIVSMTLVYSGIIGSTRLFQRQAP